MTFDWTEERLDTLRRLWWQGQTGKAIADHFGDGVSRSAVIAKARRLGFSRDGEKPREPRAYKNGKGYPSKEKPPPLQAPLPPREPERKLPAAHSPELPAPVTAVTVNVPNRASLGTSGPPHRPVSVAKIQCDEPTMPVGRHKHIPSAMLPPRVPQPAPFGPRPIEQLEPQHCRFPLGGLMDAPPFSFCGEAALGAGPYCREHAARAYQPRGGRTA